MAILISGSAGCASISPQAQIEPVSAGYESLVLRYRMDAGRLGVPMTVARPHEGQQVSFQQTPSNPFPDHSLVTLSIKYPHPEDHADYALVEVVVENDPSRPDPKATNSGWFGWLGVVRRAARDNLPGVKLGDGVHEAWALDVPRSEIDGLLARLAGSGYFGPAASTYCGVQLATKIDGRAVNKNWWRVPELEALVERVRNEGHLISYTAPAGLDPLAIPSPSVLAYRQSFGAGGGFGRGPSIQPMAPAMGPVGPGDRIAATAVGPAAVPPYAWQAPPHTLSPVRLVRLPPVRPMY